MKINEFKEKVNEKRVSVVSKAKELGKAGLEKAKQTGEWIKENPAEAAEAGMYAAIGTAMAVLTGASLIAADKAKKSVYSEDINMNVELKKKLNNHDKVELDYRMKNGETKIEALRNMNKIKGE